jgi:hypothetical protein
MDCASSGLRQPWNPDGQQCRGYHKLLGVIYQLLSQVTSHNEHSMNRAESEEGISGYRHRISAIWPNGHRGRLGKSDSRPHVVRPSAGYSTQCLLLVQRAARARRLAPCSIHVTGVPWEWHVGRVDVCWSGVRNGFRLTQGGHLHQRYRCEIKLHICPPSCFSKQQVSRSIGQTGRQTLAFLKVSAARYGIGHGRGQMRPD